MLRASGHACGGVWYGDAAAVVAGAGATTVAAVVVAAAAADRFRGLFSSDDGI